MEDNELQRRLTTTGILQRARWWMRDYFAHAHMSAEDISYSLAMMKNNVDVYFANDAFARLITHFVMVLLSIEAGLEAFRERETSKPYKRN